MMLLNNRITSILFARNHSFTEAAAQIELAESAHNEGTCVDHDHDVSRGLLSGHAKLSIDRNVLPCRSCLTRGFRRIALFAPILTLTILYGYHSRFECSAK